MSQKFLTPNEEEKEKKRNKTRMMMMIMMIIIKVTDVISIWGKSDNI
jgi:predicted nucleic acid-binding Zn ribbon protein